MENQKSIAELQRMLAEEEKKETDEFLKTLGDNISARRKVYQTKIDSTSKLIHEKNQEEFEQELKKAEEKGAKEGAAKAKEEFIKKHGESNIARKRQTELLLGLSKQMDANEDTILYK